MGAFLGIIIVLALVAIPVSISRARTSARKASNATVRRSLDLTSTRSPGELGDIIARGLTGVGLTELNSFDGTRFFRLNKVTQLELKAWSEDSRSRARLYLPAVRSESGRPAKLAPVGNAMTAAENSVRRADPAAIIH